MRTMGLLLSLTLASAASGCSEMLGVEGERTLLVTATSPEAGAEKVAPGHSACAEQIAGEPPVSVKIEMLVIDLATLRMAASYTGTPIPGAEFRVCARLDFGCAQPLLVTHVGDDGRGTLEVPFLFDGFYEVRRDGFYPVILNRAAPTGNETVLVPLVSAALLDTMRAVASLEFASDKAVAMVTTRDCSGHESPGVRYEELSGAGKTVYVSDGLPSTASTATDGTGSAIIYDLPPGIVSVRARSGEQEIRTSSSLVRAGWLTFIQIRP